MNDTHTSFHITREDGNGDSGPSSQATPQGARRRSTFKAGLTKLYEKAKRPSQTGGHSVDLAFVILAAVVYGALYFGLGSEFLPGHAAWDTLLLWVSALIGSIVAYYLYLPNVIGMLTAGIMLKNIPWNAIDAFPSAWGNQMRAAALATIFLRCGLELDFGTMKRFRGPATRLALIPGLAEAFYDGGIASAIFGMPILLGFTLGFILKAVGPGLVVPAMFKLQKTGLGRDQGIPSTVVIAASFDDIVAITGYSIFSSLAITSTENKAWKIAEGPLQVVFGIVGGILAGVALGCTRIFDSKLKRLVGTYGSCLLLMFFLGHFDMKAGGALGALTVGLIASNAWEKGFPRFASLGPSYEYSPAIERWMNLVWIWVMEPMLFVTIGASINFETLDHGTIPRALIIIVSGVCVRQIMTFLAMMGQGYSYKERVFFAIAWTPKATVQAALSATPLAMIQSVIPPSDPDYADWIKWGNDILTTGIFAIIVCGTLGVLAIHFTSSLLLKPAEGAESAAVSPPGTMKVAEPSQPVRASIEASGLGTPVPEIGHAAPAHVRRPSSAQSGHEMGLVTDDDYELIAEYIDAIRHLTAAAKAEKPDKDEVRRLSDMVMHIQQRIETEVGRREPSVREMFRTASYLASRRSLMAGSPASAAAGSHRGGAVAAPPAGGRGSTGARGGNGTSTAATRQVQQQQQQQQQQAGASTAQQNHDGVSSSHSNRPGSPGDQV